MQQRSIADRSEAVERQRPRALLASVATVTTTFGEVTAAVGRTSAGSPHEVFLRGAPPGSDASTIVEAIARLASLALQIPSSVPAHTRLCDVIDALASIPGSRPSTDSVVGAIPDAVAAALKSAFCVRASDVPMAH